MNRLEGKRALVTGGASAVGAAVVRALVDQGAMVVAVDTTDERIEQAVESLGLEDSDAVVTRGLDEPDFLSWWDLANFVISYYQELDVFVHITECKCAKPALGLGIQELREAQATSTESFLLAINRLEKGQYVHERRESGDELPMKIVLDHAVGVDQGDEVASWLEQVTVCERCIIITTDQETGERKRSDLLQTLNKFRRREKGERFGSGLIFGAYMGVAKEGNVRVGDRLTVEFKAPA